jgi:hypothetical protein
VTGFETARTVRYTGQDPDEVRRAFAADSERALAAGYVVTRSRWDTSAGPPALVVDYLHASMDRPAGAQRPAGAAMPAPRVSGRGGLGEALLIAGVILAVIVALAVTIPTSPPAAPTAAPAAVIVESAAPAVAASESPVAAGSAESSSSVAPVESPA